MKELKKKIQRKKRKIQSGGRYDLLCFYYFNTSTFTFLLLQANGHVAQEGFQNYENLLVPSNTQVDYQKYFKTTLAIFIIHMIFNMKFYSF